MAWEDYTGIAIGAQVEEVTYATPQKPVDVRGTLIWWLSPWMDHYVGVVAVREGGYKEVPLACLREIQPQKYKDPAITTVGKLTTDIERQQNT